MIQDRLHFHRVPGLTRLASKLKASATACISIVPLGLVAGHTPDVDRAIQGIDGFTAIELAQLSQSAPAR